MRRAILCNRDKSNRYRLASSTSGWWSTFAKSIPWSCGQGFAVNALQFVLEFRPLFVLALDDGVYLSTSEDGESSDIKPKHQDDHSSQRSVRGAIAIEEMQIETKSKGSNEPQRHSSSAAGGDPIPFSNFQIGSEIVNQRERDKHGRERNRPLQHFPCKPESFAKPKMRSESLADFSAV